jgi:hypothetical protein
MNQCAKFLVGSETLASACLQAMLVIQQQRKPYPIGLSGNKREYVHIASSPILIFQKFFAILPVACCEKIA